VELAGDGLTLAGIRRLLVLEAQVRELQNELAETKRELLDREPADS
jgi:hypothetical protein